MTAASQVDLDTQIVDAAQDRTKLLAQLAREAATPTGRWLVLRQEAARGDVIEEVVSGHRWEWRAQRVAHRRERQHAHEAGGHYTVRRAS